MSRSDGEVKLQTPNASRMDVVFESCRYGPITHAEEETGELFQKADDRGTSDSTGEYETFSTDVLQSMG